MSRTSRKSELSPSVTGGRGSTNIDLGKRDSVDMGGKTSPSVTSGGVGISREVTSIGGVSVTAGVSVDISPIDLGVNYDPSQNSVSVAAGAEIPGGLLGVSGGVTIDLDTGEVTGGQVGVEGLGLGVNISNSKDGGLGIGVSIQIPFTPIEFELGFGFPSRKKEPIAAPSPTATDSPKPFPPGALPTSGGNTGCTVVVAREYKRWQFYQGKAILASHWTSDGNFRKSEQKYISYSYSYRYIALYRDPPSNEPLPSGFVPDFFPNWQQYSKVDSFTHGGLYGASGKEDEVYKDINNACNYYYADSFQIVATTYKIVYSDCPLSNDLPPPAPSSAPSSSLFPNPPPRKRNKMDECCRESIRLQRLIVRHLGATSASSQETLPNGVRAVGSSQDGIRQAYPFIVRKRWVEPNAKENEGIPILNDRQLALVLGGMIERLERVLGTSEFYKDPDNKLRQSEGNMLSWLTGKNKDFNYPDPNDFWVNSDDGIINEKLLEVRSIADGLRYQIEALNRLERILPIAELKDSSIPARWIHPQGEGQLRVGNLIHLCEYMIRKDDRDRGYWPQSIKIKDADPAVPGDQGIHMDFHSQGDLLRFLTQQIIDTNGDVDLGSNYDLRRTYLDIMAFQLTVKNNRYLQAITEFMNFEITESVDKVSIPFDFFAGQNKGAIEEFWNKYGLGDGDDVKFPSSNTESEIEKLSEGVLQNSELEIAVVNFGNDTEGETSTNQNRKEPQTLNGMLLEILKHSSASAAAVTERVSEGALERAVDAAGLARKLEAFLMKKNVREAIGIGDLDNWISSAEKGYTDNPESESLRFPESDASQPYGRPATRNPTIREIDTKNPQAD